MKKILFIAVAIILATSCHAQTDSMTFAGRIEIRNMMFILLWTSMKIIS